MWPTAVSAGLPEPGGGRRWRRRRPDRLPNGYLHPRTGVPLQVRRGRSDRSEMTGRVVGDMSEMTGRVVDDRSEVTGRVVGDKSEVTGRVIGDRSEVTGRVVDDRSEVTGR